MNKFKNFVLIRGYVETASTAVILISHNEGFDTLKEAMASIATILKATVDEENNAIIDRAKRYPKYYSQAPLINVYDFINDWWGSDGQSLHAHAWEKFDEAGWSFFFSDFDWKNKIEVESTEQHLWDVLSEE